MTVQVKHSLKAEDVRKGDVIGTPARVVIKKDVKVKYVYLTVGEPEQQFKYELGTPVVILREERTDEEKRADEIEFAARTLRRMMEGALNGADPVTGRTYEVKSGRADYSAFTTIVEAEFALQQWAFVKDHAERIQQASIEELAAKPLEERDHRDLITADEALLKAALRLKKKLTEDMIENRFRGGSTSHMSNAIEVTRRETAAKLLRDLSWATV